jgi:6-phosphogluconate dehydrogenase
MAGLGVMGANLARNIERHGYRVAVWDQNRSLTDHFAAVAGRSGNFLIAGEPGDFVRAVGRPRKIMMMVQAGPPVDRTIEQLGPFLEAGDVLLDGADSWFEDTRRRAAALGARGIALIGTGVAGGVGGALEGPSLMPGGWRDAYEEIRPIWEQIAARTEDGPCVTYVGPDGAGHFVKMVHNGIEYGIMQLIAEAYDLLRHVLNMEAAELADVFAHWNEGPLNSYLVEITSDIFRARDEETKRPLVNRILDQAGQTGTGKWTAQVAFDLGVPTPTINAAVEARLISGLKRERMRASRIYGRPEHARSAGSRETFIAMTRDALLASVICTYAQGLNIIQAASRELKWEIDLAEICRVWKGGSIIRARLLGLMMAAYRRRAKLANLLLDEDFSAVIESIQANWRAAMTFALWRYGVPVPAMSASLAYFDAYHAAHLPQNLTQAQRDYFGAHAYELVDCPERGAVHTDWEEAVKKTRGREAAAARRASG